MSTKITSYKVFIASPSGLQEERRAFEKEIVQYNRIEAFDRGVSFHAVGWEDTMPGVGRPQSLINDELKQCDYFVLILHDRWGSNPGENKKNATSGTEEEYLLALDYFKDDEFPMSQIVCLFKSVPPNQLADPGPQLEKVLEFKKKIEKDKTLYYSSFSSIDEFGLLIRKNLAKWLREDKSESGGYIYPQMQPGLSMISNIKYDTSSDYPNDEAQKLIVEAWNYANEGRLVDAEITFSKAIIISPSEMQLLEFSRFLTRVGQIDKSNVMIDRAIELAKSGKNAEMEALAYSYKGVFHNLKGNLDDSVYMYKKSLEIYEKLGDIAGMANQYGNLGIIFRARGDLDEAIDMYRKSMGINEKLGRLEILATDYTNLGIVLEMRGDLDGAEDMFKKSLQIYKKFGLFVKMANTYGSLGIVLHKRNNLDGAEEMHKKSLQINQKYGQLTGMASNYVNLGTIFGMRGNLDSAEEMHKKSLEIYKNLGHIEGLASSYGNLGTIFQIRGNLDSAEEMFIKSLEINDKLDRKYEKVYNYLSLGEILYKRGDKESALEMFEKSLKIAENIGVIDLVNSIKGILIRRKLI